MPRQRHHIIARIVAEPRALAEWGLEDAPQEGGRPIVIGGREFERLRLRGASASALDVVALPSTNWAVPALIEVTQRTGSYDGRARWRVCVRDVRRSGSDGYEPGELRLDYEAPNVRLLVDVGGRYTLESAPITVFTRASVCTREGLDRLVGWHWRRYYTHLSHEAVVEVTALMVAEIGAAPDTSLGEANRLASRLLYRASRERGYSKLTRRERERLGLPDDRQWWHRDQLDPIRAERFGVADASGAGQWTLDAARPAGLVGRWEE